MFSPGRASANYAEPRRSSRNPINNANTEWLSAVKAEIGLNKQKIKYLKEVEASREAQRSEQQSDDVFYEEKQLEVSQLEQELDAQRERNALRKEGMKDLVERRRRLLQETASLKEELCAVEWAVEKEARLLDKTQVRPFKLSKGEVKSIFSYFAEPDGTANCLRLKNLLRVWRDLWQAQGQLSIDLPLKAKQLIVEAFDDEVTYTGFVQWSDFWEVYSSRWTDIFSEGLNL